MTHRAAQKLELGGGSREGGGLVVAGRWRAETPYSCPVGPRRCVVADSGKVDLPAEKPSRGCEAVACDVRPDTMFQVEPEARYPAPAWRSSFAESEVRWALPIASCSKLSTDAKQA